jgi:hypothetical protein
VVINGNLKSAEGHHLNSFLAFSRGSLAHLWRSVEAMDEATRFSSIPCGWIWKRTEEK